MTIVGLMDEVTPAVRIAGACSAVLKRADGTLLGDQLDGAGFVRACFARGGRSRARGCSSRGRVQSARQLARAANNVDHHVVHGALRFHPFPALGLLDFLSTAARVPNT